MLTGNKHIESWLCTKKERQQAGSLPPFPKINKRRRVYEWKVTLLHQNMSPISHEVFSLQKIPLPPGGNWCNTKRRIRADSGGEGNKTAFPPLHTPLTRLNLVVGPTATSNRHFVRSSSSSSTSLDRRSRSRCRRFGDRLSAYYTHTRACVCIAKQHNHVVHDG